MPTTSRQNSNNGRFSGRGGRGRGRGRGRGGGRRNYRRRNNKYDTPKPKKFIERCPFIVGTLEWGLWKKERTSYISNTPFTRGDIDPSNFPTAFNMKNENNDINMFNLQKKMINNKWRLREDYEGQFFEHDRLTDQRIRVYTHMTRDGRIFKLPIIARDEDKEGLACSIIYTASQDFYTIESNEYVNYSDTRYGRRREKYLKYMAGRMQNREEIQKEEAAIAKANRLSKKAFSNTISRV